MTRVRVHWNLTRKDFVVRTLPTRPGAYRYADAVCLRDARFIVSDAGRAMCRRKRGRWVHAWVEGTLCDCDGGHAGTFVTYNPFRDEQFRTADGETVREATHVRFSIGPDRKPVTRVVR
jgi:hypothetical protein